MVSLTVKWSKSSYPETWLIKPISRQSSILHPKGFYKPKVSWLFQALMKWDIAVKWLVKLCEKNKSDHWKLIFNRSISKRKKERKKKETSGNFLGRFFKVSEKILETKSPFSQSWLAFHKRVVNYTWESNDLATTPPQLSIYTWLNSNQSFL